jgi:hypothetical protein
MVKKQKEAEQLPLEELYVSFKNRVTNMDHGKATTLAVVGLVLSGLLITASSVLYHYGILGSWLPALIGTPAGIILFLLGLGLVYRNSNINNWPVFQMRENLSFRQRTKGVIIWVVVYLVLFIPLGSYVPYGLGGSLIICLALTAVTTMRRTEEEFNLAQQGIPDPRDIAAAAEKDEYAEVPLADSEDVEADNLYYDDESGSVGGKLK